MTNLILINKKIKPFKKKISISGDKSISIRCVLLASQAIGRSKITNLLESEDVINALKAIKKLGINFKKVKNNYFINGLGLNGFKPNKNIVINAGNSGTLARLIIGLLVDYKHKVKIIGDKSLSRRDFSRVTEPLKTFGANISSRDGKLPVIISGSEFLRPINYVENIGSAQCKSSVIFAALKTPGKTNIKAKKSRNHTEILLKNLKLPITITTNKNYDLISLNGQNNFDSFSYNVPGDISSASFFLVLTILANNSEIIIKNVNVNLSRFGIIKILNKMNCNIILKNKKKYKGETVADLYVKSVKNIKSISCPANWNSSAIDEYLVIFLVAARAKGISSFKKLSELNKKESPRLDIGLKFLNSIGIKTKRIGDNIKIYGNPNLKLENQYVIKDFMKDHRVFMMSCVAALTFGGKWKIYNKDSVNTSFPKFFKILKKIGARFI